MQILIADLFCFGEERLKVEEVKWGGGWGIIKKNRWIQPKQILLSVNFFFF